MILRIIFFNIFNFPISFCTRKNSFVLCSVSCHGIISVVKLMMNLCRVFSNNRVLFCCNRKWLKRKNGKMENKSTYIFFTWWTSQTVKRFSLCSSRKMVPSLLCYHYLLFRTAKRWTKWISRIYSPFSLSHLNTVQLLLPEKAFSLEQNDCSACIRIYIHIWYDATS